VGTTQPLVVGEPYAVGWSAEVNGIDQTITRTTDGHRGLLLDSGRNRVRLSYRPPGLGLGLGISLLGGLTCLILIVRASKPVAPQEELGENQ